MIAVYAFRGVNVLVSTSRDGRIMAGGLRTLEFHIARGSSSREPVRGLVGLIHHALRSKDTERLRREARALAALNHANILTIYDIGHADGLPFLVLEWVGGGPLGVRSFRPPLSSEDFLGVAMPVAEALGAAHEQGIVRRDVKPANVLAGDDGRIRLADPAVKWEWPDLRLFWERLAERFAVVRYDGRGMGMSDAFGGDFTEETRQFDLDAVLKAVGAETAVLLGVSEGGWTAATYAVQNPERVSHLILYGSYSRGARVRPGYDPEEDQAPATLIRKGWGRQPVWTIAKHRGPES